MPDREKVTKALRCSANDALHCFDSSCLYHEPGCDCNKSKIMLDALELLKEQEAEIAFLKGMQLQSIHNMNMEEVGNAVATLLQLKGR